jgi:Bor protein
MKKNIILRKPILIIGLSMLLLTINSCTTIHAYQTGGPLGREGGNMPSTEWESKMTHQFLWGAIRQDVVIQNCALGDGTRINIEEFKVEKNFGCMLANVLTLGIWEPTKISWRCAKPRN